MKCLLCVVGCAALVVLASALSDANPSKPKFRVAESRDDLWRFATGESSESFTAEDEYVCILSNKLKFLTGRDDAVYNNRDWCRNWEHFKVEFGTNGNARFMRHGTDMYIYCKDDDTVILRAGKKSQSRFQVFLDESDDRMALLNNYTEKFLVAKSDGSMRCDGNSKYSSEAMFLGWKSGPKRVWTPSDREVFIEKFDNSHSRRITKFEYTKTIGYSKTKDTKAGIRGKEDLSFGGVPALFKEGFESAMETDWASETSGVWKSAKKEEGTVTVYPETTVKLYQVVGYYGPFEIRSNNFLEHELPQKEIQETT